MGFETQPGREPSGTPTVQLRFGLFFWKSL